MAAPWQQPTPWGPHMRIGDAEREAATGALSEHYTAGRLSKDEYDDRLSRAWAARTDGELAPLFADLPQPHAVPARPAAGASLAAPPRPRRSRGSAVSWIALILGVLLITAITDVPWVLMFILVAVMLSKRSCRR